MDKLSRFITRLLYLTIIVLALVVIGLRISLANIDLFKDDIESWLARDVAPGIRFVGIEGGWNQLNPFIRLSDASITLPDRRQTTAISDITVEIDILKSLRFRSIVVREVAGTINRLSLRKDNKQQWWLNEIRLGGLNREKAKSNLGQLIAQIPHYLRLDLNQLIVFDEASDEKYEIENMEVDAQHRDGSYYLQLIARLPDQLGNDLILKSIIGPEKSTGYLKSDRLELGRLARLFGFNTGGIKQAEFGGEVWFNSINNQALAMSGDISINEGLFQPPDGGALLPFAVDSRINVFQAENQWFINNHFNSLSVNYHSLQGFDSELRVAVQGGQITTVDGWVENFELNNLRVLDRRLVPGKVVNALMQSQLRGRLDDAWFSFEPQNISSLQFMTQAVNISSEPVNGIPGINRAGGQIVYGDRNAGLEVGGSQMSLDFDGRFRAPLEIDRFKMKADISLLEDGLVLSVPVFEAANSDIKAVGRLWMQTDEGERPFLYLRANLEDGIGGSTAKYLPVKIMSENLVNWLDKGIRAVDISKGNLLFHGRLDSIKSFDQNRSGEMRVDFDVDNTEILFDSNWAPARKGKGHVQFHNVGVDIDLERVSFSSVDTASARVSIADFVNAVVKADINTRTPTDTALQTWIGTPVGRQYKSIVDKLHHAEGSVQADIAIALPLKTGSTDQRVNVNIQFEDAAVKVPEWGLEFSEIEGGLQVTKQGITGKGIKALYYDDPVVIDVITDEKRDQTVIDANGRIDSRRLLTLLPDYLRQGLTGPSQWGIRVGIANQQPISAKPTVQIHARSNLEDTEVLFPDPFKKPVNSNRQAAVNVSIFENDLIDFNLDYGSEIKARGQLKQDARKDYQLSALELGFSTSLRPLSSTGINFYGSLSSFPLDEWIEYYQTQIASTNANMGDALGLMDRVDLDIQSTLFHGRAFTDTHLIMERAGSGFTGTVASSLMKGDFAIPIQHSPQNPVVVNLDYLKIQPQDSESQSTGMLPQDFFSLKLRSKEMSYGDFLVADFRIDTQVENNQLTVDTLAFRHEKVSLTSSASWQYTAETKKHHSALNLSITGKELGQTLSATGFGDTMQNGEIDMDGQIRWSGELLQIDWDSLIGDARLIITDGVLINIEPGSGRLLGLLSLNALPRRLALDFKDVLHEGMGFDKISGIYKIEGENLYTSDTRMKGVSADVKISGKIGLRERNYDQTMLVTPKIRQTIPVIGGIAAGSTVGWGLLLLQNLFKKAIDKSVEIEYKVTGSWDDPQVELVKKEVIKREERRINER